MPQFRTHFYPDLSPVLRFGWRERDYLWQAVTWFLLSVSYFGSGTIKSCKCFPVSGRSGGRDCDSLGIWQYRCDTTSVASCPSHFCEGSTISLKRAVCAVDTGLRLNCALSWHCFSVADQEFKNGATGEQCRDCVYNVYHFIFRLELGLIFTQDF